MSCRSQKCGFQQGWRLGKHEKGLSEHCTVSGEDQQEEKGKILVGDGTEKGNLRMHLRSHVQISNCNTYSTYLCDPAKDHSRCRRADEDLDAETKGECEQRSKVGECVLSEVPGAPTDESVWVFLQLERLNQQLKPCR